MKNCYLFPNSSFVETWDLKNKDEAYDVIPEIWQGHNVADFIDPDIMEVTAVSFTFLIISMVVKSQNPYSYSPWYKNCVFV